MFNFGLHYIAALKSQIPLLIQRDASETLQRARIALSIQVVLVLNDLAAQAIAKDCARRGLSVAIISCKFIGLLRRLLANDRNVVCVVVAL